MTSPVTRCRGERCTSMLTLPSHARRSGAGGRHPDTRSFLALPALLELWASFAAAQTRYAATAAGHVRPQPYSAYEVHDSVGRLIRFYLSEDAKSGTLPLVGMRWRSTSARTNWRSLSIDVPSGACGRATNYGRGAYRATFAARRFPPAVVLRAVEVVVFGPRAIERGLPRNALRRGTGGPAFRRMASMSARWNAMAAGAGAACGRSSTPPRRLDN